MHIRDQRFKLMKVLSPQGPEIRYRIGNSGSVEVYAIIIGIIIIKMWGNLGHPLIDPVATVVAISNLVYRL